MSDKKRNFHIYAKGQYIGTVLATAEEIRLYMPWSVQIGSCVDVFASLLKVEQR
jgi:hypothetical protein